LLKITSKPPDTLRFQNTLSQCPSNRQQLTLVLGSELLTGVLMDRLTHRTIILTMDADSYFLKASAGRRGAAGTQDAAPQNQVTAFNPETGKIIQA
jgi:hypothetical protein